MSNMTNGKAITNTDIYDRLERLRIEVTQKIDATSANHNAELKDLRRQFETLEAGRLTRAEGNISQLGLDLQKAITQLNGNIDIVKQSGGDLSAKAAIIGTIVVIILTGLSAAVFYKLVVKQ